MVKNVCNAGDPFSFSFFFFLGDPFLILGSGRSSGEGRGNPLQYSCLENSMDREAWQATVRGVSKSWTWLSDWHLHFHHCIKKLKRYTRIWKFGCLWEWQVGNGADRSRMGGHLFTVFFFLNNFIHLFACFWLFWVFLAPWVFPGCSERRLLSSCGTQASHRHGFLCSGAWAPDHRLSHCGTWALLLCSTSDLPRWGIEPVSPAL